MCNQLSRMPQFKLQAKLINFRALKMDESNITGTAHLMVFIPDMNSNGTFHFHEKIISLCQKFTYLW
jgi:hypothetical protein